MCFGVAGYSAVKRGVLFCLNLELIFPVICLIWLANGLFMKALSLNFCLSDFPAQQLRNLRACALKSLLCYACLSEEMNRGSLIGQNLTCVNI